MAEKSTSFDQIAPHAPRNVPINYVAAPMPAPEDGAEVVVNILPNQLVITYGSD